MVNTHIYISYGRYLIAPNQSTYPFATKLHMFDASLPSDGFLFVAWLFLTACTSKHRRIQPKTVYLRIKK